MRKHADILFVSVFSVFCVLGALFYFLNGGYSFGKSIVTLGGLGWLLLTAAFIVFLLLKKAIPAAVCSGAICLGQVWILFCWIVILGRPVLLPRLHVMMPWSWGVAIHLLILILGVIVFQRVKKIK